jgi:hypothetical protein
LTPFALGTSPSRISYTFGCIPDAMEWTIIVRIRLLYTRVCERFATILRMANGPVLSARLDACVVA